MATGLFYKKNRPCFADRVPGLADSPLAARRYDPAQVQALLDQA
jgi:hypothetical protein